MKKRGLAITCFILVACLVIGIGYAAVESRLAVETDVTVGTNTSDYQVAFTTNSKADTVTPGKTDVSANTYTIKPKDGNAATLDIVINSGVFTEKDQVLTVIGEIQNNSSQYRATFSAAPTVTYVTQLISGEDLDDYLDVTCTMPVDTDLNPGDVTTVTITITAKKMPTTAIENANVRVAINHSAAPLSTGG